SAEPTGNPHDANIEKGIKWISDNYKTLLNGESHTQYYPYYGLFGIERIGVASGYKYLGNVNWYDDGANYLLKDQKQNGGWSGTINTALAMLFLVRGRAPVLMNKLEYTIAGPAARAGANAAARTSEANWNQRPRDAAN